MSLKAMADKVREEQARLKRNAPAVHREQEIEAKQNWEEKKRWVWQVARPVFEEAFGRSFSPHRFYFSTGEG